MRWIDATFMRGGTSKGLFFREQDLPRAGPVRDRVFLLALGSPDPFGRQLDGMGGGLSSLSKVVTVAVSDRPDIDLEYTFGQVAVDAPMVDYSGNCGNLSSAVVPYALESGLLQLADGPRTTALCAAVAAQLPRSIVHSVLREDIDPQALRIATPSGVVTAGANVRWSADGLPTAEGASLYRTARPLMRGQVAVPMEISTNAATG